MVSSVYSESPLLKTLQPAKASDFRWTSVLFLVQETRATLLDLSVMCTVFSHVVAAADRNLLKPQAKRFGL